jgi:Zn-dependent protease
MLGLSLTQIVVRIIAFVLITGVHGLVLVGVARLLGDRGPTQDGRLSANPAAHIDLLGLVAALFSRTGWIKPIDLDPAAMRTGRLGLVLVALAGLAAVIAFGLLMLMLRSPVIASLPAQYTVYALLILNAVGEMSIWFAVFNLIPIPPLTGGYILAAVAPSLARTILRQAVWVSLALAVLMAVTRGNWLRPAVDPLIGLLIGR